MTRATSTGERFATGGFREILPGPRTFGESLSRDINGELFPRLLDADPVAGIISSVFFYGGDES